MVSVSIRYLFYQPMERKALHGEGIVRLANRVAVWRQSKVSINFLKVLRHEVLSPECSINQPKATHIFVSVR